MIQLVNQETSYAIHLKDNGRLVDDSITGIKIICRVKTVQLNNVNAGVLDKAGDMYIADTFNYKIRMVITDNITTTNNILLLVILLTRELLLILVITFLVQCQHWMIPMLLLLTKMETSTSLILQIKEFEWYSKLIIRSLLWLIIRFRIAPHWFPSNKYTPSKSWILMHLLAPELLLQRISWWF